MLIDEEMTEALQRAVDRQPFVPTLPPVMTRYRQLRARQRGVAAVAVVGVVAVAGGLIITLAAGHGHSGEPELSASDQALVTAYADWGPARGDLVHDETFTSEALLAWSDQHLSDLEGTPRILFAGQTPDGPAAVIDQRSTDPEVGIYAATIVRTDDSSNVCGTDPLCFDSQWDGFETPNEPGYSASGIDLVATPASRHVVILPTDASAAVSVSIGHWLSATGRVTRSWQSAPTTAGVADVAMPQRFSAWDTLVRIGDRAGGSTELAVATPVGTNDGPPPPSNVVGNWILTGAPDSSISTGPGETKIPDAMIDQTWVRAHAGPLEPFGQSAWQLWGQLPRSGDILLAQQFWFYGDQAHTVVILEHDGDNQLVLDKLSNASARPLIATRLPDNDGWLIAGGPGTRITGYRSNKSAPWSKPSRLLFDDHGSARGATHFLDPTSKAAVIPTNAPVLQVRVSVNGRSRTVTERS